MSISLNSQTTNINNIQPKPQTAFRAQTTPVKDYPPDTVEIQGKKKGLSTGAKWGIGLGLTALTGIGAYLISRGRIGTKSAKQIAEHIDFKPAKTVEEAIEYGKNNLLIKNYKGFDSKDLEVINYINESLVSANNKIKTKEALVTDIIYESLEKNRGFACLRDNNKLILNKNFIRNIDDEIAHIADVAIKEGTITKTSDGMKFYKAFNDGVVSNKVENLLNKHLNTKNLNLKEKIELMDYLHDLHYLNSKILELPHDKIKELLDKNTIFALTSNSSHKHIYHELGHKIHSKNTTLDNFYKMGKIEELKEWGIKDTAIIEEFLNDKTIQKTAGKVSDYAKESPLEFVADTFAGLLDGKTYSDDVMALYKKYGGPVI